MEIPEILTTIKQKVNAHPLISAKDKLIVLHILKQVFREWQRVEEKQYAFVPGDVEEQDWGNIFGKIFGGK